MAGARKPVARRPQRSKRSRLRDATLREVMIILYDERGGSDATTDYR